MRIREIIISLLAFAFLTSCNKSDEENIDMQKYNVELNSYANEYLLGLKSVLIKNMQVGGPLKAINVCSDTASEMTITFSEKNKVNVKRVSFKNRNKNNTPDSFEEKAIIYFSELAQNEKLSKDASLIEKVKIDEREVIKYARPIFIEAPCLNCHGSNEQISAEVNDFLNNKYPEDKATGYEIGDLRGVISVTKKM